MHLTGRSHRGELVDGAPAATACVEDGVVWMNGDVAETPVGDAGVAYVHPPEVEAAEETMGLKALVFQVQPPHGTQSVCHEDYRAFIGSTQEGRRGRARARPLRASTRRWRPPRPAAWRAGGSARGSSAP